MNNKSIETVMEQLTDVNIDNEKISSKMQPAKTQKQLKQEYMDIISTEVWPDDKKMQDYCEKTCAYIVELSNGDIIVRQKPHIQTHFCFGMGMDGVYTDDEREEAESLADNVRANVNYFVSENMKDIMRDIEALNKCVSGKLECYIFPAYSGQSAKSKLKTYSIVEVIYNPEFAPYRWKHLADAKKMEVEDILKIIAGLQEVRKYMEKRLNTYLKRYGLEKLHVWTYCRD